MHLYETYYNKLQPYFGQEIIQLHNIDTNASVLTMNTKNFIKDLKNLEDLFDFSNLDENQEKFWNKNKKFIGKFEIETPKNIWIDEFVCLISKKSSFKCGSKNYNKLKSTSKSQSKHTKIEEYYNCLFGGEDQKECDKYILWSINHEMCAQQKNQHYLYSMINDVK